MIPAPSIWNTEVNDGTTNVELSCQALPKLKMLDPNYYSYFKPPGFEVICSAIVDNWNRLHKNSENKA